MVHAFLYLWENINMKKFFIFTALILTSINLFAQDIITKRNGEEIAAKVLNINDKEINYIKWSNMDGPTYTIAISEVFMIKYENGEKDLFDKKTDSEQTINKSKEAKQIETIMPILNTTNKETNIDFLKRESLLRQARGWYIAGTIIAIGGIAGGICLGTFGEGHSLVEASLALGIPLFCVGTYCWVKGYKCKTKAYKINIASVPLGKFYLKGVTIEPNANFLSYENNKNKAFGIGAKISF